MTIRIRLISALAGMFIALHSNGQSAPDTPAGTWSGSYQPPSLQLPLVVRFSKTSGGFAAETQSPNQSFLFDPVDSVSFDKKHVSIIQSRFNALFTADLTGNTLIGTLLEQGNTSKLFLVHVFPDGISCAAADPLVGEWRGSIELPLAAIPLVLSISGTGTNLGATIQTPSVNPMAHPVDTISYIDGVVTFHQATTGIEFSGKIMGNTLSGTLTQNGYATSLILKRQK
jgi:hypothetical protein